MLSQSIAVLQLPQDHLKCSENTVDARLEWNRGTVCAHGKSSGSNYYLVHGFSGLTQGKERPIKAIGLLHQFLKIKGKNPHHRLVMQRGIKAGVRGQLERAAVVPGTW